MNTTTLLAYPLTFILFVAIDLIWLMGPGRPFYVAEIGSLLRANPNLAAAAAFYLIYPVGLVVFAVLAAVQGAAPQQALWQGALFGFMAYATYDLTNLAVMNGFTLKIAMIDLVWGSILSGVVSWLATKILLAFGV